MPNPMTVEVWQTVGTLITLRQWEENGEQVFRAEADEEGDVFIAGQINAIARMLNSLGVPNKSMLRLISKALSMSKRFKLVFC